jgi:hypothetical protein
VTQPGRVTNAGRRGRMWGTVSEDTDDQEASFNGWRNDAGRGREDKVYFGVHAALRAVSWGWVGGEAKWPGDDAQ